MARPCKICTLKKSNSKAYKSITNKINGIVEDGLSMAKFIKQFNEEFGTDIIPMNTVRHKQHTKGSKTAERKTKAREKEEQEMEVYSADGKLLYTNIKEIIADLGKRERTFCEAYVNKHNHNATGAYLEAFQTDNYGSAASKASALIKNVNIQLYISHLINERSKNLKVSSSFVITGLMENYSRCMQADPILNREGEPIGIYNFNPNAANKALELIGKHIGMFEKGDNQGDQKKTYNRLIQKMADNEISPVMALFELAKEKLPFQDMAKLLLAKADLTQITEGPQRESDNLKKASTNELEDRLRAVTAKKEKLKCS